MLKRFLKISIAILVMWLVIWQALAAFVSFKGKQMLAGKLAGICGTAVSIASIEVDPFFKITVRGIDAGRLFGVEAVAIRPDLKGLLVGKIVIDDLEIINPRGVLVPGQQQIRVSAGSGSRQMPAVVLRHVRIRGGDITIIDRSAAAEFGYHFSDTNLSVAVNEGLIDFELKAEFMPGKALRPAGLLATGWIKWPERNMLSTIVLKDIEILDFSPYFSRYIDVDKTEIVSARCDLSGDVQSLDNKVVADCRMECSSVLFQDLPKHVAPGRDRMLAAVVVEALKQGAGGRGMPFLEFSFTTELDRPRLPVGRAIATAFEKKLSQEVSIEPFNLKAVTDLPGRLVGSTWKSVQGLTRGSLDPTIKSGADLKNAVSETFYRIKVGPRKNQ